MSKRHPGPRYWTCQCGCGTVSLYNERGPVPKYIRSHRPKYSYESAKRLVYRKRDWIYQVKSENGCAVCGERESLVLDFHHIDPQEKDKHISQMRSKTYEAIEAEMRKCIVLCCTHHKLIEAGKIPCPTQELMISAPTRLVVGGGARDRKIT